MQQSTTITQKWQMTIPQKIRELIGLEEPGKFYIQVVDKDKKVIKIEKKPSILALEDSLPKKNNQGEVIDFEKIREKMEKDYQRL